MLSTKITADLAALDSAIAAIKPWKGSRAQIDALKAAVVTLKADLEIQSDAAATEILACRNALSDAQAEIARLQAIVDAIPAPVDCVLSAWSAWGPCVNGQQSRTRTVITPPSNGGSACGPLTETQACTPPTPPPPTPSADAEADWVARSTAAGVTYAQDFRDPSVTDFFFENNPGELAFITRDTTDGVTGGACLRITTPTSYSGPNGSSFRHPLNSAWTLNNQSFGTDPFWFSWRMKFNFGRFIPSTPGEGWKFFNLAQFSVEDGGITGYSNTTAEIVGADLSHRGFPQAYHQNGTAFAVFDELFGGDDYKFQNAVDNGASLPNATRFCLYSGVGTGYRGCWHWPAEEWITLKCRVKIATLNGSAGNEFDMWAAPLDAASWLHLLTASNFTLGSCQDGYSSSNGIHWTQYETNRTSSTQDVITKFDQIIVSTQDIALPAATAFPAWRAGLAVNEWVNLPGTAMVNFPPTVNPGGYGYTSLPDKMDAWCGLAIDQRTSEVWSPANGGHNGYLGNEVCKFDLNSDSPVWTEVWRSDSYAEINPPTSTERYATGNPVSCHSYYALHVVNARNRVMRVLGSAGSSTAIITDLIEGFDVNAAVGVNAWDAIHFWADGPAAALTACSSCKDTVTEDVYFFNDNYSVHKWTQLTNVWTTISSSPPEDLTEITPAYDSLRRRILLIKGQRDFPNNPYTFDPVTNAFTLRTFSGAGLAALNAASKQVGMIYEPTLDAFLVRLGRAAGGAVYSINAGTFEVTLLTTTGGGSIPAVQDVSVDIGGENVYTRFLYAPQLRGVVFFPAYAADAWFMRTH